jgi:hypothetical protein
MGDRLTVGQRTLTPPVLVRIQLPQPDFINAPEASPFGKACSGSAWVSPDPNSQRDAGCEWPGRRGLQGGRGPGSPAAATGRVAGCFRSHPPALAPRVAGQAIQEQPRRGRPRAPGGTGAASALSHPAAPMPAVPAPSRPMPPRVPSREAFGRRPSARADSSRRAGIRTPSPQRSIEPVAMISNRRRIAFQEPIEAC